jgi:hypothetical protein
MNTSATHFLSKPDGRIPIDPASLAYFRQRNRGLAYSIVINEFEKSGISQADLAARLHKGADQISRCLGSPGNWTMDTYSDLLFAISGGAPTYGVSYPLELSPRNQVCPEWMEIHTYDVAFPSVDARAMADQTVQLVWDKNIRKSPPATYQSGNTEYVNLRFAHVREVNDASRR